MKILEKRYLLLSLSGLDLRRQPILTMTTSFSRFSTASLPETTADAIGFFEAVAIAGLEKQFIRIPATVQRRHFGNVPFGKLGVKIEGSKCQTIKAIDFGRDFDTQEAYWSMADKAWVSPHDNRVMQVFPKA